MCAWRNLNSTPFVFTGDGLKHRPVPDLTLGTPFNPPERLVARLSWFLGLPINIAYFFTIPDVKKESCQKWVAVSFIVCIAWIAVLSYTLVWMVTIIGYTFEIPDAVMGLTLVAFGSSVPDCSSSLFIARKGKYVIIPVAIDHNTHRIRMATRLSHKCHVDRRTHLERDLRPTPPYGRR